jgi:hypothetical protein
MIPIDPYHRERLVWLRTFVRRNLPHFITLAALLLLAVMERVTAANPPF